MTRDVGSEEREGRSEHRREGDERSRPGIAAAGTSIARPITTGSTPRPTIERAPRPQRPGRASCPADPNAISTCAEPARATTSRRAASAAPRRATPTSAPVREARREVRARPPPKHTIPDAERGEHDAGTTISWSRTSGPTTPSATAAATLQPRRRRERARGDVERESRRRSRRPAPASPSRSRRTNGAMHGADRGEQRARPRHQHPREGVGREDRRRHHERVERLDRAVGGLEVVDPPERRDQPREEARAPVLDAAARRRARLGDRARDLRRTRSRRRRARASDASTPARRRGSRSTRNENSSGQTREQAVAERAAARRRRRSVVTRRSRCSPRRRQGAEQPAGRPARRTGRRRGARSRSPRRRAKILAGKSRSVCVFVTKR